MLLRRRRLPPRRAAGDDGARRRRRHRPPRRQGASVAHVAAQDARRCAAGQPRLRELVGRRPPDRRAARSRSGARRPRRSGLATSAAPERQGRSGRGSPGRATPTARRRWRRGRRRAHRSSTRPPAGVTRCDGVPVRLFPRVYDFDSGALPARSCRRCPSPGIEKLVARRGDPAMPAGRAAGRLPLDRGVEHARLGRRRARAGLPRRAERRRRRDRLGRGDGRRRARRVRHRALDRRRLRRPRPARVSRATAPAWTRSARKNRVRRFQIAFGARARAALRRRDPGRSGRRRRPLARPVLGAAAEADAGVVRDRDRHGAWRWARTRRRPKSFGAAAIGDLAVFTELDSPQGAERLVSDLVGAPDCTARLPLLVGLGGPAVLPTAQAVMGAKGFGARVPDRRADHAGAGARRARSCWRRWRRRCRARRDKEERLVTAALSRAEAVPAVAAGGAAGVGEGAGRRSGARGARARHARRSARRRGADRRARAAGRRRCGRRWSARSGARPSCPARRCWRRSPPDRTTADRARRTCCGRCRRWSSAIRPGATRCSGRCGRRWRRSAASRCAARAVMALGTLGGAGDPGALAQLREKQRRPGAALPGDARAGGAGAAAAPASTFAPPCAARSRTAIRACARPRRWRWASRATTNPPRR